MRIAFLTGLALCLGACVSGGGEPPPLPRLAEDSQQPALALFEHVLAGYFAGAGASAPTTCAALTPTPLTADQEEQLIARFVRLAPAGRCRAQGGGVVDSITDGPAALVQVYDFACRDGTVCSAWAVVPGQPATRYAMRFIGGEWRFDSDRRLLAE